MLLGLALPFWLQGRVALAPTWHNTLALLASGLLAMILGIWAVTALSGDYRARGFLDYFARVRGVNPRAARMVAISAAAISVALLLALSVVP